MSKHTPGPWRVGKPYGTWAVEITTADGAWQIAAVRNAKRVRRDDWVPVPEGVANAALIADAPRLQAEHEKVGRLLAKLATIGWLCRQDFDEALAAVKQARGE